MSCPLLMKWVISSCRGHERPYVPSLLELEEYCNGKKHEQCPVFRGFSKTDAAGLRILNRIGCGDGTVHGVG